MPIDTANTGSTGSSMGHIDEFIANLSPEEVDYLCAAAEAVKADGKEPMTEEPAEDAKPAGEGKPNFVPFED